MNEKLDLLRAICVYRWDLFSIDLTEDEHIDLRVQLNKMEAQFQELRDKDPIKLKEGEVYVYSIPSIPYLQSSTVNLIAKSLKVLDPEGQEITNYRYHESRLITEGDKFTWTVPYLEYGPRNTKPNIRHAEIPF